VDPGFAREPRRGKRNRELGRAGERNLGPGKVGAVRVVKSEDARRTVPLDGATVVGVHEGADEERGEEGAKDHESHALSKRSPMKQAAHRVEPTPRAGQGQT
jgi:hypothetical protein